MFDLVDLRAELENFLRFNGMTPVLSDRPSSDFAISQDRNAIQTCLENVRSSDVFVLVLSRRYGPSLGKVGFDDVSATHLEYNEATKAGMPVLVYLRDRLVAEYDLWRRNRDANPPVKFTWTQKDPGAEYPRVFNLIDQHRDLHAESEQNNWYWAFDTSVSLKDRMLRDLRARAGRDTVEQLIDSGSIPIFFMRPQSNGSPSHPEWLVQHVLSFQVFQHLLGDARLLDEDGTPVGGAPIRLKKPDQTIQTNAVRIKLDSEGTGSRRTMLEVHTVSGHKLRYHFVTRIQARTLVGTTLEAVQYIDAAPIRALGPNEPF